MKKFFLFLVPFIMGVLVASCDENSNDPEEGDGTGTGQEGKNLVAAWSGAGTPQAAGWVETGGAVTWDVADGTTLGACRYRNTTLETNIVYEDGSARYSAPELMLRFDNNKYEGTVYYFPTSEELIKGKKYKLSFGYHVGNSGAKILIAGVASSTESTRETVKGDDGSDILSDTMNDIVGSAEFTTNETPTSARKAEVEITAASDAIHYIFFKYKAGSSNSHPWFGVGALDFQIVVE
ncbi:MAG: hypothetical protein LBG15_01240 [Dysgonamonadaceae bacterium]|jgi:hypothetical protein|nr:hypothetical protein [Dysgonamonadaceae bacterium]